MSLCSCTVNYIRHDYIQSQMPWASSIFKIVSAKNKIPFIIVKPNVSAYYNFFRICIFNQATSALCLHTMLLNGQKLMMSMHQILQKDRLKHFFKKITNMLLNLKCLYHTSFISCWKSKQTQSTFLRKVLYK